MFPIQQMKFEFGFPKARNGTEVYLARCNQVAKIDSDYNHADRNFGVS